MIHWLLLSVWPSLLVRESLGAAVQMPSVQVESWWVHEPREKVQRALKRIPCELLLPEAESIWVCVNQEAIYAWNYGATPTIWSETRRRESSSKNDVEFSNGQFYEWQAGQEQIQVKQDPRSLFQIRFALEQEIKTRPENRIVLQDYTAQHLVLGWRTKEQMIWVTAWKNNQGQVSYIRVKKKDDMDEK